MTSPSVDGEILASRFADSLFSQDKIEVSWAGMSDEEREAYLIAAKAALSAPRVEAPVPQPISPRDREIMGTSEAAKQTLIEKAREWRRLRQPSMDTRAGHRKTEDEEREARFQLANAALLWLWHEENPL